ncbi:hypothetical protein [Dactylosporangium sp. NPDC051541]|uniref:hypothetical protein n=1 Tax=Dactylosporangium sp. NPDC051541 TaxID=3363977 RepID=UPI0037B8AEDA
MYTSRARVGAVGAGRRRLRERREHGGGAGLHRTDRRHRAVQIRSPQPGNFGDTCKPVEVRGYRVFLPDETAADFAPAPQTVCSADGVGRAQVGPVISGLSQ